MHQRKVSDAPVGPSGPLRQTYNQLPFVAAPFYSKTRNTRMARGMVVPLTDSNPNQAQVITHNLGRLVQGMLIIANGANGELYPPQIAFTIGTGSVRTAAQQSVQVSAKTVSALVWVF